MDAGKGTSADGNHHASLPACARKGRKAPRSPAAAPAQTRCSTKCDPASETTRFDEEQEPQQHQRWADLPADIIGVVVVRLPLLEDRARLRSVCRAWRAAARIQCRPPLPLLVMFDFSFSSICAEGTFTGARRRVPLPERVTASADRVHCVGSFEGWLVGVKLNKGRYFGDLRCFIMNAFSGNVVRLPRPSAGARRLDTYSRSLPIVNGSGVVNCTINAAQCVMSFCKVMLSTSPDSGSKCIAVAISNLKGSVKLAFWQSGMKSWCVCDGDCITEFIDIAFCQGKLYMLSTRAFTTVLIAFEICEDNHGLMVSRVEGSEFKLPVVTDKYYETWRIVEWHGKLLVISTYSGDTELGYMVVEVRVFEADLSTNPVRFTEIKNLDGDCIFISPCNSKSFRSSDYDGVGEDLVYHIDSNLCPDNFVYNMKDGTMTRLATDELDDKFWERDGRLMDATWFFPPE